MELKKHKTIESVPEHVMDALTAYDWPGNVRELRNMAERLGLKRTTLQSRMKKIGIQRPV